MSNVLKALAASVAIHMALALFMAMMLKLDDHVTLPTLDLSAVEVSFSRDKSEDKTAVVEQPEVAQTTEQPEEAATQEEPTPEPDQPPPPPAPEPDPPPPPLPEPVREPEPGPQPAPPEPPPPPQPKPELPPPPQQVEPREPSPAPEHDATPVPTPPTPAPDQAKVDAPPRPLKTIRPDYPKGARQRNEEGDVVLELSITEHGTVSSVSVVSSSGFADLDAAAVRAAERARFSPAKSGRKSISSTARMTITFRLTQK